MTVASNGPAKRASWPLVGWDQAEEHGQAGATAEQGRDAVAAQEDGGMVGGGMAVRGVGIGAAPGFDRGAVDNEVARADDAPTDGLLNGEHEERLAGRGTGSRRALPLLRGAGHPRRAVGAGRQDAGEHQDRPRAQLVGHGARREVPEGPQQRDQQQRLVAVPARGTTRPLGQGRLATAPGLTHGHTAQREHVLCEQR